MTISTSTDDTAALADALQHVSVAHSREAAATLRALAAERDALRGQLSEANRASGEAEGKLAASEMAGVVEGWKARAEAAEAEADRLRDHIEGTAKDTHAIMLRYEAKLERAKEALHKIAGEKTYADDPWSIARAALDEIKEDG